MLASKYSSPRLVVHRMEGPFVELRLVENVWCEKQTGPLCIFYVVVWLVLVYGEIWGQLEKSTPPHLFPEVLAVNISENERKRLLAVQMM